MNSMPAQPPDATPSSWPEPLYAWYVVGVLIASYAFAILDRIAIGLLVGPIKQDLGLSDTQMGLLQGAAFGIFYSLFAIPIG
ncbi:MAG: MFS transporter, partial [Rhodospirillaceae bacterium]|nr:MFS transporter [Rhodospirillaceae bacterium]